MLRSLASSVAFGSLLFLGACSSDKAVDAGPPDAGGSPDAEIDAGAPLTAAFLGQVCADTAGCPEGYTCLTVAGDTMGQCSLPCQGQTDTTTCVNDYPAANPGSPACLFSVAGPPMQTFCAIRCGTQYDPDLPLDCPTGLTCRDLAGNMGPDGLTDFCAPTP